MSCTQWHFVFLNWLVGAAQEWVWPKDRLSLPHAVSGEPACLPQVWGSTAPHSPRPLNSLGRTSSSLQQPWSGEGFERERFEGALFVNCTCNNQVWVLSIISVHGSTYCTCMIVLQWRGQGRAQSLHPLSSNQEGCGREMGGKIEFDPPCTTQNNVYSTPSLA